MKRFIALLLVALMCVSALSLAACSTKSTTSAPEANSPTKQESKPTETPSKPATETDDDGKGTPNDIFTSVNYTPNKVEEHKIQDSLPDSFTLKGTDFLPPVSDQGDIGTCASESVTYLQFTNAVARYLAKMDPNSTWKPARDAKSCFSSKYTFQFANASTAAVYNFLRDHGAVTKEVDDFERASNGRAIIFRNNTTLQTKTTRWILTEGLGEQAMAYRITNYEQYWVTDTNGKYYSTEKNEAGVTLGVQFTTSDAGKELLTKIKDAIVSGNVVVTGGYPDTWKTVKLTADTGSAKKGETVITHASYVKANGKGGGHQVSIIGYDDNIECAVPGSTEGEVMKGAFLVQNSWGASWHNKGYTWMFYDAVNTVSEFESFKISETETRDWAFDQFCFIYWDRDITTKMPGMYAELEIETTDRDALGIELGRTDAYGRYVGATPYMFVYTHPTYAEKKDFANLGSEDPFYLNTKGEVNGKATTAFYTVSFERLLANLMDGTTAENYLWSVKVTSKGGKSDDTTDTVVLKSAKIKNANGDVLQDVKFDAKNEALLNGTNTYVFQLGNGNITKGTLAGNYTLKNVASGTYLAPDGSMRFTTADKAADALKIKIQYQPETQTYLLWRIEKPATKDPTMVIDVNPKEVITTGISMQFNAQTKERAATQAWKVSHNSDGTITFYITTEKGTNYALAIVDGKFCLKKATELSDDIKWTFTSDATPVVTSSASVTPDGIVMNASVGSKVTKVSIVVSDMTGKVVATEEATVTDRAVSATVKVTEKGTYLVKVLNTEDNKAAAAFQFVTIA